MEFIIREIASGSISEKSGLKAGDRIISINGEKLIDNIDLEFLLAEEELFLVIVRDNGTKLDIHIDNHDSEDLGIVFVDTDDNHIASCCNKCIFCFVDQLPNNMRPSLYFKDDDWRMSFVMGSYVTLTNISDTEFERIKKRRVSPLYISVHATDDDVRCRMLGCKRGAGIMNRLKEFAEAEIVCHTQVVLCPGINDGSVLEKTIDDLATLYPYVRSLAVVPVGLTSHREGLYDLSSVDRETARKTISIISEKSKEFLKSFGTHFVFASDELYIRACEDIPEYELYEDFPQIENGVGLIAQFTDDANAAMNEYDSASIKAVDLATGLDFYPFLKRIANELGIKYNIEVAVHGVANDYFGRSVTVSGLLTGKDIISQLKGKITSDILFLPPNMFREFTDVTLDGMTLSEIGHQLGVRCLAPGTDGYTLVRSICEGV